MTETANPSQEMQRWAERSKRVAASRKILPVAILAIVLIMAGFIAFRTFAPGQLLEGKPGEPMVNPRFKGRDDGDRPFLIGAIQAVRLHPPLAAFLQQDMHEGAPLEVCREQLRGVLQTRA